NNAQVVARGAQEHWDSARHGNGVQDRLVAVTVHYHHVVIGHIGVPDDLVGRGRAVSHEKAVVGMEDAGGVALGIGYRAGVVQQLTQLVDRITDVGTQHVFTEKLVKHLANGAFQEGDATRVPGAVPGVRTVRRVLDQLTEKRRCQAFQVGACFTDDVTRHELGRVLEHVNEAVQLAQNIVGDMLRGARLAVQIDGDILVAEPQFTNKGAQVLDRIGDILRGIHIEFLIINRQNEGARAALLLRKRTKVTIAGDPENLYAFGLYRRGQGSNAQARRIFGTVVFVDDDDRKTKLHPELLGTRQGNA